MKLADMGLRSAQCMTFMKSAPQRAEYLFSFQVGAEHHLSRPSLSLNPIKNQPHFCLCFITSHMTQAAWLNFYFLT